MNCVFEGDGYHWIGDAATFIDCTFNVEFHDAEPVVGTVTFENCVFNKGVHFAAATSPAPDATGRFFAANECTFNGNLTVSGFESASLTDCTLSGNNWAGKNMIAYCPLVIDHCDFTTGIRLSYSDTSLVTCTNCTVNLSWAGGSATVGS